jgi:FkbM family methyltransferase
MIRADRVVAAREGAVMNPVVAVRRCRHGTMMYLRYDAYIGRSLDQYGEYSEDEVALFRDILRPGDVALDVGANIGALTIPMAQLVGPEGFVYAFEPQRIVFQILCGNIALNELGNVKAYPNAVGANGGRLKVAVPDYRIAGNFGGVSVGSAEGENIAVIALDEMSLPAVQLIKIDVEGMEVAVLRGAAATIARCRPLLYLENDRDENAAELVGSAMELGYRALWHITPLFKPDNFLRNPNNVLGRLMSFNMLCVPRETEMPAPNRGLRAIGSPAEAASFLADLTARNAE